MKVLSIVFLQVQVVLSYKILCLVPFHGRSHFYAFSRLFQALSQDRNHELYVVSYFPKHDNNTSNYNDISLVGNGVILDHIISLEDIWQPVEYFKLYWWLFKQTTYDVCSKDMFSEPIKNLIKDHDHFDLILVEYFTTNCFLALNSHFKAPVVGLSSSLMMPWVHSFVGNPENPSYIPINFEAFSHKMKFFERLKNSVIYTLTKAFYEIIIELPGNFYARSMFGKDLQPLQQMAENTSLILVNSHFTVAGAKPLVPSVVEVGGIHIEDRSELPMNIEKWINESKHGVVYFSMGSMIIGHSFPEDKRRMFQNAFSKLKQRVLWKWENDTMPGIPNNVMIQKWMPQLDILCHPNVKAFVGHAGLLGTTEAVHCGVPAVLMPQYGDQFVNAKGLKASGGGVILDFGSLTEEKILNALKTVLEPSFKKQAEELSARFKDRPMPPLDTAIYWIEYVARHKGAPHLKTAAVGMPFYQYLLLDVIAFVLAVLAVSYFVTKRVLKFVFGKICSKTATKKVKKS